MMTIYPLEDSESKVIGHKIGLPKCRNIPDHMTVISTSKTLRYIRPHAPRVQSRTRGYFRVLAHPGTSYCAFSFGRGGGCRTRNVLERTEMDTPNVRCHLAFSNILLWHSSQYSFHGGKKGNDQVKSPILVSQPVPKRATRASRLPGVTTQS